MPGGLRELVEQAWRLWCDDLRGWLSQKTGAPGFLLRKEAKCKRLIVTFVGISALKKKSRHPLEGGLEIVYTGT